MFNKLHWYCMSFSRKRQTPQGPEMDIAEIYMGYPRKYVTMRDIELAKEKAGMARGSVTTGISYMGKMTRGQVNNGHNPVLTSW